MAITQDVQSQYSHWRPEQVELVDGNPVRFRDVCVYEFSLSDVDDPDLYAGEPLWTWQQTEAGQWVMANAVEQPYWVRDVSQATFSYRYRVMARLAEQNETFWRLKWGGTTK